MTARRAGRLVALSCAAAVVLVGGTRRVAAASDCTPPAQPMARVELLFGVGVGADRVIDEAEWRRFVDEEVTPRFPEGLTELSGHGQWRRPDGVIAREPSRMLLIWYTPGTDRGQDIEAVRGRYKERFKQLSVMRVDGMDCVSF